MPLTTKERITFGALLLFALALRMHVGLNLDYQIHPDEICDYLDQGFRILSGYGCYPWTYEYGLRSYLFPGIIAGVMRLAGAPATPSGVYLGAVAAFMALMSMSIVACAIAWGRRTGGYTGAVIAGFMAATWFYNEASYNRRRPAVCVWTRPGTCRPGAVPDPDPDRPPGW